MCQRFSMCSFVSLASLADSADESSVFITTIPQLFLWWFLEGVCSARFLQCPTGGVGVIRWAAGLRKFVQPPQELQMLFFPFLMRLMEKHNPVSKHLESSCTRIVPPCSAGRGVFCGALCPHVLIPTAEVIHSVVIFLVHLLFKLVQLWCVPEFLGVRWARNNDFGKSNKQFQIFQPERWRSSTWEAALAPSWVSCVSRSKTGLTWNTE